MRWGQSRKGTVPKVSAGTVHGSTEWCRRELSPQTHTDKPAGVTCIHSWEKNFLGRGNIERQGQRVFSGDWTRRGLDPCGTVSGNVKHPLCQLWPPSRIRRPGFRCLVLPSAVFLMRVPPPLWQSPGWLSRGVRVQYRGQVCVRVRGAGNSGKRYTDSSPVCIWHEYCIRLR